MKLAKKELQDTIHYCTKMGLWKKLLITSIGIWELTENCSYDTLTGYKTGWNSCPYCGLETKGVAYFKWHGEKCKHKPIST
jgi:hypothetical protein